MAKKTKQIKASKPQKPKTKAKSAKRVQNAFEIAAAEERARNGDDSDDESDGAIVNARRRFKGSDDESGDDEEDFEDEEIDSDEALGSDDEFDVLNSKFSQTLRDKATAQKKKGSKKAAEYSDSEDEGYNSIDENDLLPLSAVWDMDDKDLKATTKKSQKDGQAQDIVLDDNWETESSEDDEEDDESESGSESESDDSEEEEGVEGEDEFPFDEPNSDEEDEVELTTLKKSLQKKEKKSKKNYENLNIAENELSLPGGGNDITLTDMISIVDQDASKRAILIDKEETDTSGKSLAIPLPKRIQQRHDRKAAYEISKDEVNKWKDTVKQNREAEVLSFPMNPTVEHNAVSTFAPTPALTDLEKKVNSLLTESSLLDDKQESKFEEIKTAKMSPEEMKKRTAELRKMRELMFRQEREAKRLKKIKSKSFRRIKKKEMLKNKEMMGDDDSDDDEHDRKRAQERMSLKHKNNAYARSLVKSGLSKDAESREEMEAMLRRGESLKAKILDRDDDDDEFDDMKNMELGNEDEDQQNDSEELEKVGKTGVLNMAFMKNAEARQKIANAEMRANLRKLESTGDLEEFENQEEESAVNVTINPGRRVYTPGAADANSGMKELNQQVLEEYEEDQEKTLSKRLEKGHKKSIMDGSSKENDSSEKSEVTANEDVEEVNPWAIADDDNKTQKSRKIKVVDRDSSKMEKSAAKLSKQKQNKRKAAEMDDADEILEMDDIVKVVDPHGDDSAEDSGDENPGKIRMFKQTDLMKQAFAGDDDIIADFEAEKKETVEKEGDQVEDLTLPGWGDWIGGKNKVKKNKFVKKTKGVDVNKRRDKNLKGVIINEKINKKNAKYQSSAVPFPYENREQYERSLRMPIGQEWTSRETHQRLTMPKVIAKPGVVIDPLKAPFQ